MTSQQIGVATDGIHEDNVRTFSTTFIIRNNVKKTLLFPAHDVVMGYEIVTDKAKSTSTLSL